MTPLPIELRGQALLLHPQRVMLWPARRTLIAADLHFGKGAWFRRQGVAVPSGNSQADLVRLTELIQAYDIQRLLLLGDVFHHRPSAAEPFQQAFAQWRRQHADLHILAVVGNHDQHGADQLFGDSIEWITEWREQGFLFRHEPATDTQGDYVLAGHLHPVWCLNQGSDRLRAPVFWLRSSYGVLPSFGSLTGGYPVQPQAGDRLFLVGPQQITAYTA